MSKAQKMIAACKTRKSSGSVRERVNGIELFNTNQIALMIRELAVWMQKHGVRPDLPGGFSLAALRNAGHNIGPITVELQERRGHSTEFYDKR